VTRVVALIPARAGSKRVPGKNIRRLAGHPLMAYTIRAALASGVFADVVVSTDSEEYAAIARHYGAQTPFRRPAELAGDLSPDIEWVTHALDSLEQQGLEYEAFSLLRVTSPFRQPETIQRAWRAFQAESGVDSLRAVEKCKQHPGKMWVVRGQRMQPFLPLGPAEQPWHSSQYQALPLVYAQNASLEIAWSRVVREQHTIAGTAIVPFLTQDYEGFDVNQPIDWLLAETILAHGLASLPAVDLTPFPI
jgi:CMP-N,N'-diacetyllegionaminic acid synthase